MFQSVKLTYLPFAETESGWLRESAHTCRADGVVPCADAACGRSPFPTITKHNASVTPTASDCSGPSGLSTTPLAVPALGPPSRRPPRVNLARVGVHGTAAVIKVAGAPGSLPQFPSPGDPDIRWRYAPISFHDSAWLVRRPPFVRLQPAQSGRALPQQATSSGQKARCIISAAISPPWQKALSAHLSSIPAWLIPARSIRVLTAPPDKPHVLRERGRSRWHFGPPPTQRVWFSFELGATSNHSSREMPLFTQPAPPQHPSPPAGCLRLEEAPRVRNRWNAFDSSRSRCGPVQSRRTSSRNSPRRYEAQPPPAFSDRCRLRCSGLSTMATRSRIATKHFGPRTENPVNCSASGHATDIPVRKSVEAQIASLHRNPSGHSSLS